MTKWEYKVVTFSGDDGRDDSRKMHEIAELGEAGWELVSAVSQGHVGYPAIISLFFKRRFLRMEEVDWNRVHAERCAND